MKDPNKNKYKSNKWKAYANNAATDNTNTADVSEGAVPIASELSVEEARDWVNNGSLL
ncbi:MAG TPA: hypothetical protein GXX26_12290 [Clostridiaceae bacterium]|nr:hypothetical protein [Clostridiaceae bacterium]